MISVIKLNPLNWRTSWVQDTRSTSGKPFEGVGLNWHFSYLPKMLAASFRRRDKCSLTYFPRGQCFNSWLSVDYGYTSLSNCSNFIFYLYLFSLHLLSFLDLMMIFPCRDGCMFSMLYLLNFGFARFQVMDATSLPYFLQSHPLVTSWKTWQIVRRTDIPRQRTWRLRIITTTTGDYDRSLGRVTLGSGHTSFHRRKFDWILLNPRSRSRTFASFTCSMLLIINMCMQRGNLVLKSPVYMARIYCYQIYVRICWLIAIGCFQVAEILGWALFSLFILCRTLNLRFLRGLVDFISGPSLYY